MSAQNDAAFLRMFLLVLGGLVAFTVIIYIAATQITGTVEERRGEDPRLRAAVLERIQPVGQVNIASAMAAAASGAAAAAPKSGAEVVAAACNSCHATGVLESPKIGDAGAWTQRLAAVGGIEGLVSSAINGKGNMPPRGGAMISDDEMRAAVEHILAESGVDGAASAAATSAPAAPAEPVQAAAEPAADSGQAAPAAVSAAPVAEAATPAAAPAAGAGDLAKGKTVYGTACFACHGTGAGGAPKLGDKAAWAPRIAQGMETLHSNAIKGKGAMPPKGGRLDLADADVIAAVAYIISESD